jgi:hypothetical protein
MKLIQLKYLIIVSEITWFFYNKARLEVKVALLVTLLEMHHT